MDSIQNSTLIALISVITTGLVSILSIFVPIIIESRKSRQASISAEKERVDTATLDLLREISHFRSPVQGDIEFSSRRPVQQVISDMQIKHYAWERAIWDKIGEKHQEQVVAVRKKFESLSWHNLNEIATQLSNVTDEILTLSRIAENHSKK
jgi:hypothetical protein